MKFWSKLLFSIAVSAFIFSCNSEDPNAQINKEIKAIDDYLQVHNTDYLAYDATGMRVVVKQFGNDAPPHTGQTVKASYTASTFPDGNVFDTGEFNDKLENISIAGVQRGLTSILKGTHAVLYIPSKYAFGSAGRTGVPANTTVVYDITLNEVTRTAAEQTQFEKDTTAIHEYIINNNVANAFMHPSGVWYSITAEGNGTQPLPYDLVTFEYTGKVLTNGSTFGTGTTTQQSVFSFIDGLKVGLPVMKAGGSYTFYIPSGYAYGPTGQKGVIDINANLIFDIKLNAVIGQ